MSKQNEVFKISDEEWMIEAYKKAEGDIKNRTKTKVSDNSGEVNVKDFAALLEKEEKEAKNQNKK